MEHVSHDLGVAPPLPWVGTYPESWSASQAEAMRLAVLRTASDVKECASEGLAVLHTAERDADYQLFIAGLRKLLVAGLSAKVLADSMLQAYGPEHEGGI